MCKSKSASACGVAPVEAKDFSLILKKFVSKCNPRNFLYMSEESLASTGATPHTLADLFLNSEMDVGVT